MNKRQDLNPDLTGSHILGISEPYVLEAVSFRPDQPSSPAHPQRLEPEQDKNNLVAPGVALQGGNELEHGWQQEVDPRDEDGRKVIHSEL